MKRTALLFVLLVSFCCGAALAADQTGRGRTGRTVSGMIYFTNNSPKDYSFFVELFTARGKRRRRAAKWTRDSGYYEFKGLRPGVYYVQVSGPSICLLQYEVDASGAQPERPTILGDAGCGHHRVPGLPAPRPVPRREKR